MMLVFHVSALFLIMSFDNIIVKVTVEPWGDSLVDLQITLAML